MPEVSIVVPVYNMEQYIKDCIQSILDQDYKNFEVIIVDDGSSDGSYDLEKEFSEKDSRINVIRKKNEGVSVARSTGIDKACGEWVMFVDPDDTLQPSLVSELLSFVNEETDIVACCCNAFCDDKSEVDYFFQNDRVFVSFDEKKDLYKQLMKISYGQPGKAYTAIGVPWGKLYRRSFLDTNRLRFNPRLKRLQDNMFNMYAFFYARSVYYYNKPLYNYRLNHIQKYIRNFNPEFQTYMEIYCEERYICLKQLKLFDDVELKAFYCDEMVRRLWEIICKGIFATENSISYKEKKKEAEGLCKKECFQLMYNGIFKVIDSKDRLKWFLIKGRHYRVISLIIKLQNIH